ncbi:hypothetical protein QUG67_22885, partial [Enterobacter hormaechei]|nr:hypothetical protein [Enterobacter hormaechei]
MGSCAAPSAKGDDKFITTDYLQQCLFSVAEYVQPSEGEPIRSVVLETRDSIIVVWHVHPGQEIAAH